MRAALLLLAVSTVYGAAGDNAGDVAYMGLCSSASDCDTSVHNYKCDTASDGDLRCFCQNGMMDDQWCG